MKKLSDSRNLFSDKWLIRTAVFCFAAAFISFILFIIQGHGVFTVRGDFNEQAIPFTMAAKDFLSAGKLDGWAWNVDLGTSSVQGMGYYTLGSPFFYLAAVFPSRFVPYLAGWIYMLKYACAGCTAYLYIRRFTKKRSSACAAAILYAFSGFQTTNLIFYIFHDVVALFPLLLIGIERILSDRKDRWLLALAVFLNAFCNYYFFVQEVVFVVLYFLFRYCWKKGLKEFLKDTVNTAVTSLAGIAMSAMLFLPQVLYILKNDRTYDQDIYSLFFDFEHLLLVIKGFLMPGESMKNLSALFEEQWDSVAAYLPMIGLVLAVAYIIKKRDALSRFLIVLFVIAFSPFLTSMFLAFTYSVQRWWFMLILILCVASARVLDGEGEYPVVGSAIGVTIATLVLIIVLVIMNKQRGPVSVIFYHNRFALYAAAAIAGYLLTGFLYKKKRLTGQITIFLILLFSIASTAVTLYFYRGSGAQTASELSDRLSLAARLETNDPQYRYNTSDNELTLPGGISGTGSFSSTVSNGIIEFDRLFDYYLSHIRMDKNEIDGLNELLGAKYQITDRNTGSVVQEITTKSGNTWYVTENAACPIGFMMDTYQLEEDLLVLPEEKRGNALLSSAVVKKADSAALAGFMQGKKETAASLDSIKNLTERNAGHAVKNFKKTNRGFSCTVTAEDNCGVYFSVPYDEGFTATIDGQPIRIIDSGGMMLLPVTKGEHEIEFVYHTPGYGTGKWISLFGWLAFLCICILQIINKRRKKR